MEQASGLCPFATFYHGNMDLEDYKVLITKELLGAATAREKETLTSWRAASAENEQLYIEYAKVWHAAPKAEPAAIPNLDEQWQEFEKATQNRNDEVRPVSKWSRTPAWPGLPRFGRSQSWAIAAAVLIATLAALFFRQQEIDAGFNEIYAAAGEEKVVELPDGSTVRLNAVTTLRYPSVFTEEDRIVEIQGEGLFSVKPDNGRFIVKAQNAQVQVLGTVFNVWSRENKTRVIVKEGRVALSAKNRGSDLVLHENQMGECDRETLSTQPVTIDASSRLGWLAGRFVFIRTPFKEVIAELERAFATTITLKDPGIGTETLTASFEKRSLHEALDSVCSAMHLSFTQSSNGYIIGE